VRLEKEDEEAVQKTNFINNDLNPRWGESPEASTFTFAVREMDGAVDLVVRDFDRIGSNRLLGESA
jgi:hypothetical protein